MFIIKYYNGYVKTSKLDTNDLKEAKRFNTFKQAIDFAKRFMNLYDIEKIEEGNE